MEGTLFYRCKINGAHHLPGYQGKCAVVHGHTYYVDLEIRGEVQPRTGMILDFHEVERIASAVPDHLNWNESIDLPTAEYIAYYLFGIYEALFGGIRTDVYLSALTVWEDPGMGVRVCA